MGRVLSLANDTDDQAAANIPPSRWTRSARWSIRSFGATTSPSQDDRPHVQSMGGLRPGGLNHRLNRNAQRNTTTKQEDNCCQQVRVKPTHLEPPQSIWQELNAQGDGAIDSDESKDKQVPIVVVEHAEPDKLPCDRWQQNVMGLEERCVPRNDASQEHNDRHRHEQVDRERKASSEERPRDGGVRDVFAAPSAHVYLCGDLRVSTAFEHLPSLRRSI